MNTPKVHENRPVQSFLQRYTRLRDLIDEHPRVDDIVSGVLAAKTAGDSATRSLSRSGLFTVLYRCPTITSKGVHRAMGNRYAERTARKYAAAATAASVHLERFAVGLPTAEEEEAAWLASPAGIRRMEVLRQQPAAHPVDDELSEQIKASLLASVSASPVLCLWAGPDGDPDEDDCCSSSKR